MTTEVRSLPAPPALLERRSASRLQLLSDHSTLSLPDAHTESKDEVIRGARRTAPFSFTPLTPILASPALAPAITSTIPSTSSANLPSSSTQNSAAGVKHKRSRSTLSRLHLPLPQQHFNPQNRARSATVPSVSGSSRSSSLLKDIVLLDGIPVVKTPLPPVDTAHQGVDFPAVSPHTSAAPKLPRPRTRSARVSFTLGSDGEDDVSEQQQKRDAAAKAKKLERYDDLRRYHALMELLKTEARYLQDLRILISVCVAFCQLRTYTNSSLQVYLQQLHHAVTSRTVASYFGASTSSSKQTPSPSPSTFNSTPTQGQPTNPPPSSVHSPSTVRRRSMGAADYADTEKDLSSTRPMFTEEDIQLLRRNSNEILSFHERFVDDLKEALAPLGSKFRFDTEDEYAYVDMPRHDTLELAIQIIVSMFVDRVSPQFPLL